uniref:Uncharacterized protein n=1 Tax=viral metagenome TaxID=1070528 RepID=A0A6M3LJE2_9ZZZZ
MKKYIILMLIVLIAIFAPFVFADNPKPIRGTQVITGDLRVGGTIYNDALDAEQAARLTQVITNGVTTSSPSEDAVFDALALKAPVASPTFTGTAIFAILTLPEKTPVNAVASAAKLTSSGALVPATHATSEIVSDATNFADGETITINATVYRFMDTPVQAYDINVGVSAAESLDFLKAAINATGTGDGSDYYAGTLVHPDVVATTNSDTVQTILARVPGDEMNAYATTETCAHAAWADTTLGGGAGNSNPGVTSAGATVTINGRAYMFVDALSEDAADAIVDQVLYGGTEAAALDNLKVAINAGATAGTNYSTGTVVNPDVTAGTNTDTTQVITAKVKGVAGDLITCTETLANTVWDDVTLGTEVAGVDGTVGVANETCADATYLYHCLATNTIADANWRRVALGSAY